MPSFSHYQDLGTPIFVSDMDFVAHLVDSIDDFSQHILGHSRDP